jgi:hypothetical protein
MTDTTQTTCEDCPRSATSGPQAPSVARVDANVAPSPEVAGPQMSAAQEEKPHRPGGQPRLSWGYNLDHTFLHRQSLSRLAEEQRASQ